MTELFHVAAELGDGRKYVACMGEFDGVWLVAVAEGGKGAGRFPSRWELRLALGTAAPT